MKNAIVKSCVKRIAYMNATLVVAIAFPVTANPEFPYPAALINLLATPERFTGKETRYVGGIFDGGDQLYLFLTGEHAQAQDVTSAVKLKFIEQLAAHDFSQCKGLYMRVSGIFVMRPELPHEIVDVWKTSWSEADTCEVSARRRAKGSMAIWPGRRRLILTMAFGKKCRIAIRNSVRFLRSNRFLLPVVLGLGLCQTALPHEAERVSLVSLLTVPERYYGKFVSVMGYFAGGPEFALYLTSRHSRNIDYKSSIGVLDLTDEAEITSSACIEQFARVEGNFIRTQDHRRMIVYVTQVTRADGSICWDRERGLR